MDVAEAARAGAAEALARTPSLLPVLEQAGVVDAGGTGYLLLFDALLTVLDGRADADAPGAPRGRFGRSTPRRPGPAGPAADARPTPSWPASATRSCTCSRRPTRPSPPFKEVWAGLGDSIVVVGGDGLWNCHIHTDDIGAAIEASLDAGRPRVDPGDRPAGGGGGGALGARGCRRPWARARPTPRSARPRSPRVVAVATGDGIGRIFRSLGVQRLIAGGQSMNPSIAELVEAVRRAGRPTR